MTARPGRWWPRVVLGCGLMLMAIGCNRADNGGQKASGFIEPAALPDLQDEEPIAESWDVHYVLEAPAGYRHTQIYRLGDGRRARQVVDVIGARRFGEISQQTLTSVEIRSPQGDVQQLGYQLDGSGEARSLLAERIGDRLYVVRRWGNRREVQVMEAIQPEVGFFTIEHSLGRAPIEPGHTRMVHVMIPLFDGRPVDVRLTAGSIETMELPGGAREVQPILAIFALQDGKHEEVEYWVDERGEIVKTRRAALDQLTIRSTQEEALRAAEPSDLDIGQDIRIPLDVHGRDLHRMPKAVYRVRLAEAPDGYSLPQSEGQQVERLGDRLWKVTVSAVRPDSPLPAGMTPDPPDSADLKPAPLIQSNHPRVLAAAQVAIGSATDPWEKAVRIEQYIHRILHVTEFSQAFAGAAETVERRRGDCSEHAVLLAACCRAVGIPARLVAGLVYSQQDQGLMYHMWNEVWVGGRWIPLDATLGQGGIGAGHLKLTGSSGDGRNIYALVAPILPLVGRMQVELAGD